MVVVAGHIRNLTVPEPQYPFVNPKTDLLYTIFQTFRFKHSEWPPLIPPLRATSTSLG